MNCRSKRLWGCFALGLAAFGNPKASHAGSHLGWYRQTTTVRTHGTPPGAIVAVQPTVGTFQLPLSSGFTYQQVAPIAGGYYYVTAPLGAVAPAQPTSPGLALPVAGAAPSYQTPVAFDPAAAAIAYPAMSRALGNPAWIARIKDLLARSAAANANGLKSGGISKAQIVAALELAAKIALGTLVGTDLSADPNIIGEITKLVGSVIGEVLGVQSAPAPPPAPPPGNGVDTSGSGSTTSGGTETIRLELPTSLRFDVYHHQVPPGTTDTTPPPTPTPAPSPDSGPAPPPAQPSGVTPPPKLPVLPPVPPAQVPTT